MSQTEHERTWTPPEHAHLPDLTTLPDVVGVGTRPVQRLVAVYHDTEDLALVRAGITLRRRSGGDDEGWHLKLPVGDDPEQREEVHEPLGEADDEPPPEPLRRLVAARVGGRTLGPVAEISTDRAVHDLRSPEGRVLAELADDRVEGRALVPGSGRADRTVRWREWELELVEGDAGLLDAADKVLAQAEARRSAVARKIEVVLGDALAARLEVATGADEADPSPGDPAREVLRARLARQASALLRHDAGMRRDAPDSLHQARVACRRLRAALATYRPLVDRTRTDPLRDELRWVARSLGHARDAEVARDLVVELLEEQPDALVRGPVRERLAEEFADAEEQARAATEEVLASERYHAVLADLEQLVLDPPWTGAAAAPAAEQLPPRVRKDFKRLRKRVSVAAEAAGPAQEADAGQAARDAYDHALHEARKAAKRLRYACEAVEPVWGDARRLRKAAKAVTQVLGERQDTTVSREQLAALAEAAEAAGEPTFTWGRLHGLEEARAADRGRQFWEVTWPAARRRKKRRWLQA